MLVVFKQKENIKPKEKIVEDLGDFILMNRSFFDIFCEIMTTCSDIDDYNKDTLYTLFLINPLIDRISSETEEFIYKIDKFFDTTNEKLDKRRGDIVEYLLEKIIPQTSTKEDFTKKTEFYIYYNGFKLGTSNHDIDVGVYSSVENFIELYECKVKLKSFLYDRPPLIKGNRRKLGYLKKVYKDLVDIDDKNIYLVCLEYNTLYYRHTLNKYGYNMIDIMDKTSIKKLMERKGQALA